MFNIYDRHFCTRTSIKFSCEYLFQDSYSWPILRLWIYNNDTSKTFHFIILLNILGKLIEKVMSSRLQIHFIVTNFIHPNQIENIKQWLTVYVDIYLTYLIWVGWIKGLYISTLAFDIAQFFLKSSASSDDSE